MWLRVLVVWCLTLCWPAVAFTFTADKRETLRGLKEISVLVEYLPDDVERAGLNREHLQHDLEGRLRQAGLHVLTISDVANAPGAPYLYVAVYPIAGPSLNSNAYAVALAVKQLVQLSRNPTTELFATTWEGPIHFSAISEATVAEIRSRIFDAVGRFIVDYRDVNAK
jgi:hypothetical protein